MPGIGTYTHATESESTRYGKISYLYHIYKALGTMMRKILYIPLLAMLLPLGAIAQTAVQRSAAGQRVTVPAMIATPEARAQYLALHYWDRFDFKSADNLRSDFTEQMFGDFITCLGNTTMTTAAKALTALMDKASANTVAYERFAALAELYLYDPNSPIRNDEYFIPVLRHLTASPRIDATTKGRYRTLLEIALRNRPGTVAADFTCTTAKGTQYRMHAVAAEYLLLYFYNPDCNNCREINRWLTHSASVAGMQSSGKLKILAVYPDGELSLWRKHLAEIPASWLCGYDKGTAIRNNDTYDLKAIPTLYLLDRNKKVLLKDTTADKLEEWFAQHLR